MQNVIGLRARIDQLEQQKWDLILAGAEVKPELQIQFEILDKKLDKLYSWLTKAMTNGVIREQQKPELRQRILIAG